MNEQTWLTSDDPAAMLRLRRTDCCGCLWMDNGDGTVSLCAGASPCGQCDNGPILPYSPISDRKLRLFAAACYRDVRDEAARYCDLDRAITSTEQWAETGRPPPGTRERSSPEDIHDDPAQHAASASSWAHYHRGRRTKADLDRFQAALLRDIVGNPFRPAKCRQTLNPLGSDLARWRAIKESPDCDCGWLAWQGGTVPKMAQVIYDERRWEDLPVLADALEDAGCTDEAILRHLRRKQEVCLYCKGKTIVEYRDGLPPCLCHVCLGESGPHVRGCWVLDLILGKE